MPKDLARLTVLLDAERKKDFDQLCAELGTNASEVVRELIARYLAEDPSHSPLLPSRRSDDASGTNGPA